MVQTICFQTELKYTEQNAFVHLCSQNVLKFKIKLELYNDIDSDNEQ